MIYLTLVCSITSLVGSIILWCLCALDGLQFVLSFKGDLFSHPWIVWLAGLCFIPVCWSIGVSIIYHHALHVFCKMVSFSLIIDSLNVDVHSSIAVLKIIILFFLLLSGDPMLSQLLNNSSQFCVIYHWVSKWEMGSLQRLLCLFLMSLTNNVGMVDRVIIVNSVEDVLLCCWYVLVTKVTGCNSHFIMMYWFQIFDKKIHFIYLQNLELF